MCHDWVTVDGLLCIHLMNAELGNGSRLGYGRWITLYSSDECRVREWVSPGLPTMDYFCSSIHLIPCRFVTYEDQCFLEILFVICVSRLSLLCSLVCPLQPCDHLLERG